MGRNYSLHDLQKYFMEAQRQNSNELSRNNYLIQISKADAEYIRNKSPQSVVITLNRQHCGRAKKYLVENTGLVRKLLAGRPAVGA